MSIEGQNAINLNPHPLSFFSRPQVETTISGVNTENSLTFFPDRLEDVLKHIPKLEAVQTGREQLRVSPITDKPYAMDLRDESRRVKELMLYGIDPHAGWENFKTLSEFYARETYGKFPVTHYRQELVNDQGKLRLWIGSQEMLAEKSYGLTLQKGGPDWYRDRCKREISGIPDWESNLQLGVDQAITFEVSPAPFEVSETDLHDTSFGTHSFVRFHQIVDEIPPHVHSVAFRVNLPPKYLEEVYENFSQEGGVAWQEMLGKFVFSNLQGIDIRDDRWIASVQLKLDDIEKKVPLQNRFPENEIAYPGCTPEKMNIYLRELEPFLEEAFSGIIDAAITDSDMYLRRALISYQGWEKLLKARLSGDWDRQIRVFEANMQTKNHQNIDRETMLRMTMEYFQSQAYQQPINSCGGGSGGASNFQQETFSVNSGSSFLMSDRLTQGGLSEKADNGCGEQGCYIQRVHLHCPGKGGTCNHAIMNTDTCGKCGLTATQWAEKTGTKVCR